MDESVRTVIAAAPYRQEPSDEDARLLAPAADLAPLLEMATLVRDHGHHALISYSRKVFIPLTQL